MKKRFRDVGAWRQFLGLAALTAFPAIGALLAAVTEGRPLRWLFAILLVVTATVLVFITIRLYRREQEALRVIAEEQDVGPEEPAADGYRKDWLDRIAPIGKGTYRESGGGLILLGVVSLGLGLWMLLGLPFWHQLRHLPAGPLGILAVLAGVYLLLMAINTFRRTPK